MKTTFEQAGWISKETQFFFFSSKVICFFVGLAVGYLVILTRVSFLNLLCYKMAYSGPHIPLRMAGADLYLKGVIKNRVD